MKIMKGIPTSESNTGSSYLSMCEKYNNFKDLEIMHSYVCNNNTFTVTGLNLLNFSYTIESHFAELLGKSFYNILEDVKGTPERFNVNGEFKFIDHKDEEKINNSNHDLKLSSFSCNDLGFRVNSI